MAFDVEGAKRAGYSQEEIDNYLNTSGATASFNVTSNQFDVEGALKAGYTEKDIATYLYNKTNQPTNVESALSKVTGIRQDYPWRRKLMSYVRPVLEGAGMVGGGAVGTAATLNPFVGGVTGGAIGYGAATKTADMLENLMGLRHETPYGKSVVGQLQKSGEDVLTGAAIEGTGRLLGGIGKMTQELTSPLSPEAKRVVEIAKKQNIRFTPADIRGTKGESLTENLLFNAPASATRAQQAKLRTLQDLTNYRERLISEVGSSDTIENVGLSIKKHLDDYVNMLEKMKGSRIEGLRDNVLKTLGSSDTYETMGMKAKEILEINSLKAVRAKNALYKEVADAIPEEKFNFNNMNSVADEELAKLLDLPNPDAKLVNTLKWASARGKATPEEVAFMEEINALPKEYQQQAIEQSGIDPGKFVARKQDTYIGFREQLNDLIKGEDLSLKKGNPNLKGQLSNEGRIYKKIKAALDKDFEQAAKDTGGDVWNKLQVANEYFAEEFSPIWKSKVIQRLGYTTPDKLADFLLRPNNAVDIKLAKKALGEKGFKPMKEKFTQELFDKSPDFASLEKQFNRYGESLPAIYDSGELKLIRDTIASGVLTEKSPTFTKGFMNIIKAIGDKPEKVVQYLIRPNNAESIRKAKLYIGPKLWKDIEGKLIEQLASTSKPIAGSPTELVSPIKLETNVFKMGDESLRAALSKENYGKLKELTLLSKYAQTAEKQAGNPSGTAQNIITWTTMGMVFREPMSGMAVAIAPNLFARLYFSPTGFKLFTKGITTPASTPAGIELASKLMGVLGVSGKSSKKYTEEGKVEEINKDNPWNDLE